MNGKDALRVQYEALRELVPQSNWRVDVLFFEKFGADLRAIIDSFSRDPTPRDLVWCLGCRRKVDPREEVRRIICEALVAQDDEPN